MRLRAHWRYALWYLLPIGLAFPVFGPNPATFLFSGLLALLAVVLSLRLRNHVVRPMEELARALRRSGTDGFAISVIPRGGHEVRDFSSGLAVWQENVRVEVIRLREAHVRLESVLRAMDEGVLVIDRSGQVIRSNAALLTLLDLPRDPLGMTAVEVFRNEALDRAVQRVLKGETVSAVEFQVGTARTLRALVSPVSQGDGRPIEAAVIVLEDLTDIRRVDRVRRDFVANVSHEFKTPLTSIRGYAETMLSEASDPVQRDFAGTILRNAAYLESLVNDLLVLARIESEPPAVLADVDVKQLIEDQVERRRQPVSDDPIGIEVECAALAVRLDPGRLAIALSNLIDNAIRHNRPTGFVRIECQAEGGWLTIDVRDQGYGIPQDELPRIFERFYRVDRSRTRDTGGTGLGLAIARHAIESQGGTLTASSQAGVGSTFRVRLPLRRVESTSQRME